MNNFFKDLKYGKRYEEEALKYFEYKKVHIPKGRFKGYDFILDDKIKVEVKSDRMAQRTGNIAIEYAYKDYDSGINATKADYYIYFIERYNKYDCYKIPVKKLKKIITKKKPRTVRGGDFKNSKMFLLKISDIKKYLVENNS